jgi:hypothetical protein
MDEIAGLPWKVRGNHGFNFVLAVETTFHGEDAKMLLPFCFGAIFGFVAAGAIISLMIMTAQRGRKYFR